MITRYPEYNITIFQARSESVHFREDAKKDLSGEENLVVVPVD